MNLKSKEVKASGGGGTGGSTFIELLMESSTTIQTLDEYIAERDGEMDLMGLTTLSEKLVLENGNLDKIVGSEELFSQLLSNYTVAPMFLMIDGVIDKVCSNPALLDRLYNAPINGDMIATKRAIPLLYNMNYLKYALSDASAMRIIAGDPILLDLAFSTMENRTIMFDQGGKPVADVLMRESSYARQWLWDNVRKSVNRGGSGSWTENRKGYMLAQVTDGGHDGGEYSHAGTFIGDYQTGNTHTGSGWDGTINHNERVQPIYIRSQTSGETSYIHYVEMSEVLS